MSEILNVIAGLPNILQMTPAKPEDISDAEIRLQLRFSAEYKQYLSACGAILAEGIELTGIAKSEHRNVVLVTKKEWMLNKQIPNNLYVVENIGIEGIIIWQDENGIIYQTTPNTQPKRIAQSLSEYLKSCKKSQ
jgi:hypothetical protein